MKKYTSNRVFDGTRPVPKKRAQKLKSETIRKKVAIINRKIAKAEEELLKFQTKCPHPTLTYKNEGSTGNWDMDDSYWRVWNCHDCGKRWQTDQDWDSKKKYPHAIDITNLGYEGKQMLEKLKGINLK